MSEPTLQVTCPACQARVAIPQSWQGKRRPCPQCHGWVTFDGGSAGAGEADGTPQTLISAPPEAATRGGGGAAVDPYGNTVMSRPGIPTGSGAIPPATLQGDSGAPLTFADRLKQAAAATTTGSGPARRPTGGQAREAAAHTPGSLPAAGGSGKINYGRDRYGEGAAQRRQAGQGGVDNEWDETGGRAGGDWSDRPRSVGGRGDRIGRRPSQPRVPEKQSVLGMLGLGAAILSVVLCAMVCIGAVAVGQAMAKNPKGATPDTWFAVIGCGALLTPVVNLVGAILSGIAVAQANEKRAIPILGLVINGIFLLGMVGLVCIGMMQN